MPAHIGEQMQRKFVLALARVVQTDDPAQRALGVDRYRDHRPHVLRLQYGVFHRVGSADVVNIFDDDRFFSAKTRHPVGRKVDGQRLKIFDLCRHTRSAPFVGVAHGGVGFVRPVKDVHAVGAGVFADGLQQRRDGDSEFLLAFCLIHTGNFVQNFVHALQLDLRKGFAVLRGFCPHGAAFQPNGVL